MEEVKDDPETANAPEPGGRWTFDANVTAAFSAMLSASIPDLETMRNAVLDVAHWALTRAGLDRPLTVDLGASRGDALAPIVDRMGARGRYLALDISEPMLDVLRERFAGYVDAGCAEVRKHDLRSGFPETAVPPSVVLLTLTLQFLPVEHRSRLLREAYVRMAPGGALVLVEKVLAETGEVEELVTAAYRSFKRHSGYSDEAIERKAMSLEGVLVPLTADGNERLLRGAGFDVVETVWRIGPFQTFVAVKRG